MALSKQVNFFISIFFLFYSSLIFEHKEPDYIITTQVVTARLKYTHYEPPAITHRIKLHRLATKYRNTQPHARNKYQSQQDTKIFTFAEPAA